LIFIAGILPNKGLRYTDLLHHHYGMGREMSARRGSRPLHAIATESLLF
jgi:hypothetical protein